MGRPPVPVRRGPPIIGVYDFERGLWCFERVETVRQSDLPQGKRRSGKTS